MVALSGYITDSSNSSERNTLIATEIGDYSLPIWPPTSALANQATIGTIQKNYPISAREKVISGFETLSFFDDYYNRIHINPRSINLGNIVSAQQDVCLIWNAYLVSRSFSELNGEADGVTADGPISAPDTWPALSEQEWTLEVARDGASDLRITLEWVFDTESVQLPIIGARIVAWPFLHNWNKSIFELLSWATDILQSRSGAEQRRSLRVNPRIVFEKEYLEQNRERQLFESLMIGWGSRVFAIPFEQDMQLLTETIYSGEQRIDCETEFLSFQVGSLVMMYDSAHSIEVAEIAGIDENGLDLSRPLLNTWQIGTRIYPSFPARLQSQPEINRLHDRASSWSASWLVMQLIEKESEAPATTYRGFPVFDIRPDESRELTHSMRRLVLELDTGLNIPRFLDTADLGFPIREHRSFDDKASHDGLRKILYYLAGRFKAVWVPTWASDLNVTQAISDTSINLTIDNIGYTRYCLNKPGTQDIRIDLKDGTVFYRRIIDSEETSTSIETLTIDSALGENISLDDIDRVAYLILCRAESDAVRIEHETDEIVKTGLIFKGVLDEL